MSTSQNMDNIEMHPYLPSGAWDGFYTYAHDVKQHRMTSDLNFINKAVSGSGTDDVAPYLWEGRYDLDDFKITMIKSYNSHQVVYSGDIDENGIWGTWKLAFGRPDIPSELLEIYLKSSNETYKGGFHIWPKKGHAKAIEEEEVVEKVAETLWRLVL